MPPPPAWQSYPRSSSSSEGRTDCDGGSIDGLLNPTDRSNTKVAIYKVNKLGTHTLARSLPAREKIRGVRGEERTTNESPPR